MDRLEEARQSLIIALMRERTGVEGMTGWVRFTVLAFMIAILSAIGIVAIVAVLDRLFGHVA